MAWTWDSLSELVRRLKMPTGEYAVGPVGHGLSRDPSSTADRVELLVTEKGWRKLKERAWQESAGGAVLRHPQHRSLTARRADLEAVQHEIGSVDDVPVLAVDPEPPAPPRTTRGDRVSSWVAVAVISGIVGVVAYGFALYFPDPDAATMRQHLTFRTTEVRAEVVTAYQGGDCPGARPLDRSEEVDLLLTWTQDGEERTGDYTACEASTDDPQDVWVTDDGAVASQHPPLRDHFWPGLVTGLPLFAVVVLPLVERLRRAWWWRRRPT